MKKIIGLLVVAVLITVGIVFYFNLKQAITLKNITINATTVAQDTVDVELNMVIDNPFFFSFDLNQLAYNVSLEGEELISENQDIDKTIDDSTFLQIPVTLNYQQVFNKLQELKAQDSTFLSFDFDITYTLPLIGTTTTSVSNAKKVPVPTLMNAQINSIDVKSFGFKNIDLDVQMKIDNPSKRSMQLDNLKFDVTLNESNLVEGMKWETVNIPEKEVVTFTIPIKVNTGALAKEFFDKLTEGEEIKVYLDGNAILISPNIPGDSIELVIDTEGAIEL